DEGSTLQPLTGRRLESSRSTDPTAAQLVSTSEVSLNKASGDEREVVAVGEQGMPEDMPLDSFIGPNFQPKQGHSGFKSLVDVHMQTVRKLAPVLSGAAP